MLCITEKERPQDLPPCSYLDDSIVTQKGRVAAEIQSADELVLSELIFNSNLKVMSMLKEASRPMVGSCGSRPA